MSWDWKPVVIELPPTCRRDGRSFRSNLESRWALLCQRLVLRLNVAGQAVGPMIALSLWHWRQVSHFRVGSVLEVGRQLPEGEPRGKAAPKH